MNKKETRQRKALSLPTLYTLTPEGERFERALSAKIHKKAVAVMEEAIFGTNDVHTIAILLDSTINQYTAAHPVDLIFYEASSGVF
jgi:hypothetical protein